MATVAAETSPATPAHASTNASVPAAPATTAHARPNLHVGTTPTATLEVPSATAAASADRGHRATVPPSAAVDTKAHGPRNGSAGLMPRIAPATSSATIPSAMNATPSGRAPTSAAATPAGASAAIPAIARRPSSLVSDVSGHSRWTWAQAARTPTAATALHGSDASTRTASTIPATTPTHAPSTGIAPGRRRSCHSRSASAATTATGPVQPSPARSCTPASASHSSGAWIVWVSVTPSRSASASDVTRVASPTRTSEPALHPAAPSSNSVSPSASAAPGINDRRASCDHHGSGHTRTTTAVAATATDTSAHCMADHSSSVARPAPGSRSPIPHTAVQSIGATSRRTEMSRRRAPSTA